MLNSDDMGGVKRFVFKTLLFAIPWVVMLVVSEVYVENLPNISRDKHQWMLKNSQSVHTLVLGHSHMLYGVRPDMLPCAFSLAQQSQTYRYDSYLLQHYPMDSLKTVILPFNYSALWEDFESQSGEEFQAMRYRIYMDCDIHPRFSWYGFEVMHFPLVREKLKSLYTKGKNEWDEYGWATDYTYAERPEPWDDGRERVENNTSDRMDLVSLNSGFIEEIFAFCRKRDVKVLLVNTPVSPLFYKYQDKRQVAVNDSVLHRVLTLYPEVQYINLENSADFTEKDFYDSEHLNTDGATHLTALLSGYCLPK